MSPPRSAARRLQITAAAIAVALIAAFLLVHSMRSRAERELADDTKALAAAPPPVVAVVAERAPDSAALTLPGETAPWYESTIYSRVPGYVANWFVDIGDRVEKGQVLATIDTPELDAELAAAQAKLKSAEAQVKVRDAEAQFARTTYERWRDSPKGVVSDQEREAKKADFASAAARLNAANADVNVDRGEVDRLTALTQFKQVTAPYDGTIIERRIDIGNLVTAGSASTTTLLYRMAQNDPMRIFVDVPQNVAPDVAAGLPVTIAAPGRVGAPVSARVVRTAKAIDPRARTLRAEIDVPNPNGKLVPGMYVEVALQLKSVATVQVPAAALLFRAAGPQVAVIGGDNVVHFRDVEIGRDDGNVVEIASGLEPGDRIALNISNQIGDGEKVAVTGTHLPGAVAEEAAGR